MKRSVSHATFTIERTYNASPARVYKALSDPAAKALWFGGPDDWTQGKHTMDFRLGGVERESGGPPGGPVHYYEARFQNIVPNERIIITYEMKLDETPISVSVATMEIVPSGKGAKLTYTEMGAFLDGHDVGGDLRRKGSEDLLDKLGTTLAE